jgi:type II secretory pathway component GspD/PulD (secretin)
MRAALILSAILCAAASLADDEKRASITQQRPAVEPKRGAYVVKYAAAKDLAGLLAKHFKGAAEIQTGPEGTSNCLLVNAPPVVFDEVMKTLEKLDRRPHSVAVEIFVVELPRHKIDDKDNRPEEKDFSGSIDELPRSLEAMMKNGHVASFRRIQFSTLEGQVGTLTQTERKPFATSATTTTYLDVGTRIKVTPQVTADESVTRDLNVQDSRDRDSGDHGKPEFIMTSLTGKISVASGRAALAKDAKVVSKEGQGETLIVVGARVADPEAKAK